MKKGGGEGRKRFSLFSSPCPPPCSFTRANFRVIFDSRSSLFNPNQTESLLHSLLLLQTLSYYLSCMVPFTHLVLQSLQCFSKVVRVIFSVNTEAFETDSNNNTDTDSQNFHRDNRNNNDTVNCSYKLPRI